MKRIILSLLIIAGAIFANAEVVNVCGTDTIILQVSNYQNGTIEWQESIDARNWTIIPEQTGETYIFFPSETKFYRAVVKTTDCEPLYSDTSFVQLPPIANAGVDRTIGTSSMTLSGNSSIGAIGVWTIIKGNNGVINDPTAPNAILTGKDNETYQLKWTLTNACGQSSDTVNITFNQLDAYSNFIVVDNTDSIFSDSIQLSEGIYKIKFSDQAISPQDSVILIGMREDIRFLRRTTSFTLQDSIYTFNTIQGTLADIFKSGVLNIGDAINQALTSQTPPNGSSGVKGFNGIKRQNIFPTRKTLDEIKNTKNIQILYVEDNDIIQNKNTIQKVNSKTDNMSDVSDCIKLSIDDLTLFESDDEIFSIKLSDAYIKLYPRFVCDYNYSFPTTLSDIKIGIDNAQFEYNLKTIIAASKGLSWKESKKILDYDQLIIIYVSGIPIMIDANISLKASGNFSIGGAIKYEQTKNYKLNLTALIKGNDVSNLQFYMPKPTTTSTNTENFITQADLNSELKIGPEISFLLYGIVGPYLNLPAKLNISAKADDNLNWNAKASIGFEGYIGASADIVIPKTWFSPEVNVNLFHFEHTLFNNAYTKSLTLPYKVELLSGDFQTGSAGSILSKPIGIKVTSSTGFGVPFVPVRFTTGSGNGKVEKNTLLTNAKGEVYPNWTLGENQQNKLTVNVFDGDSKNIFNSPMYIYASTQQNNDCLNSSLYISLQTKDGKIFPSVSGGVKPYSFSTDGVNYSSLLPSFDLYNSQSITLYVKDKNGCIRTRTINSKSSDVCANSTLSMDILIQPNILTVSGKNGVQPYLYSLNNDAYGTQSSFYKLESGNHIVSVKDANGCTASQSVNIVAPYTVPSISASYPADGSHYIPANSINFQWTTGNYASNQVYDVYLKSVNSSYSLIASNLTTTSFLHSVELENNTTYYWKIDIKVDGKVIDFKEFSFTTSSGISTTPNIPTLLTPVNGSSNNNSNITLTWKAQKGDFVYDVYLDTQNASTLIATNVKDTAFHLNSLISDNKYFWKVKIKNQSTGEFKFSNIHNFTTTSPNSYSLVFSDDFNDASVTESKFSFYNPNNRYGTTLAHSVIDGYLELRQDVTDAHSQAIVNFDFTNAKKIKIVCDLFYHDGHDKKSYHYYFPQIGLIAYTPSNYSMDASIQFLMQTDYYSPDNPCGSNTQPSLRYWLSSHENLSCPIDFKRMNTFESRTSDSFYDKWLNNAIIVFDKTLGYVSVDIDGDGLIDVEGYIPSSEMNSYNFNTIYFSPYGWWTGHFMRIRNLKIYAM